MSKLNTVEALKLALFIVCDIDLKDEDKIISRVYKLTDSDRQRVLKLAYQYTQEYTI